MANSITLINYRTKKCAPMKSITRLSKQQAFELAAKLFEENPLPGFDRFGSGFEEYYNKRLETEKWLHSEFIAKGGKPQAEHPLYFFVHEWDLVDKVWQAKDKAVTEILLSEVDSCHISFNFGDSIALFTKPDRKIFLKEELERHLLDKDGDIGKLLDDVQVKYGVRAIEAHIWSDEYFLQEDD
ncbi:MAG: hypothetical protein FWB74_09775 [Defluviitaleaceae bacterium]|nr:hypothetical protein [Defluviitaleaceae bacterium]